MGDGKPTTNPRPEVYLPGVEENVAPEMVAEEGASYPSKGTPNVLLTAPIDDLLKKRGTTDPFFGRTH